MKKILVISWFYPPINSSEGLVTYKLLSNSDLKYDVYTQKDNKLWSYGNNDYLPTQNNITCIFSQANNLKDWKKEVIEYYRKNIDKYDIIMSRSMPEESHEVGLEIKKINPNVKWIASFGDPIAHNPFTIKTLQQENPYSIKQRYNRKMGILEIISIKRIIKSAIWKKRYKSMTNFSLNDKNKLQDKVLKNADKIICNSKYQFNYMFKGYNDLEKSKCFVIPHSYDSELYPKVSNAKNEKLRFVYIGHLDDIRTPKLLLSAINLLKNTDSDFENKVIFEFYGNMGDKDKLYILNNDLVDIVKFKKHVSYTESLKIMKEANWLIHVDANISSIIDENIFFAAKLADYLGSRTNIFGITMLNGASADILRKTNSLVVSHSVDEIKNYLYLIVSENYKLKVNDKEREQFNAVNVSKNFDKEILGILEK